MTRAMMILGASLLLAHPLAAEEAAPEAKAPGMPAAVVENGQTLGPVFAAGEHCAGYAGRKSYTFAGSADVVAKNCAIEVKVEADGARRRVVVSAPLEGFYSGSSRRDKDVAAYLGGKAMAPVTVASDWLQKETFDALASGKGGEVAGLVKVMEKETKVNLIVSGGPQAILVRVPTSFKTLGLPKLRIMAGLIGSVLDPLTLTAQIQVDKVVMPAAPAKEEGKK